MKLLQIILHAAILQHMLLLGAAWLQRRAMSLPRSRCSRSSVFQMNGAEDALVVMGRAGSVAETIACKLLDKGKRVTAVLDQKPLSPKLAQAAGGSADVVYYQDEDDQSILIDCSTARKQDSSEVLAKVCSGRVLVVTDDDGDFDLRTQRLVKFQVEELQKKKRRGDDKGSQFIAPFARKIPSSVSSIFCCSSAAGIKETAKGGLGVIFGATGTEAFSSWSEKNGKPCGILQYGELIGGVPENGPVPFVGLPLQEPELHPSYVLQSVVCSSASTNQYASAEKCTRAALAEVAVRMLQESDMKASQDTLVISIPGAEMTENDWEKLFKRMQATGNAELLRVEFGAVLKKKAFINWIIDSWFPQALIDADAATILRGARPVRATKSSDNAVQITWEDIQPDLSIKPAGALEIAIIASEGDNETVPFLSVRRLTDGSLPGEQQLMDRLVEAINKNVYKKQFCTPIST